MGAPRSATPRRTSSSAPPSAMAPAATGTGMPAKGSQARPPPMKPDSRASPPASSTAATNALEASRSRGDPLRSGMNSPTPHTIRTCAEALSIQPWRVTRSHSSSPGAVPTIAGTWISVPTSVSSRTIRPAKRAPAWRPRDRPTTPAAQRISAAPVVTGPAPSSERRAIPCSAIGPSATQRPAAAAAPARSRAQVTAVQNDRCRRTCQPPFPLEAVSTGGFRHSADRHFRRVL